MRHSEHRDVEYQGHRADTPISKLFALTIRYGGSLTTPPCSEGVKWNLFTAPITMDQAQINTFLEAYSGNNRTVQPLNGRRVLLDETMKK